MAQKGAILVSDEVKRALAEQTVLMLARVLPDIMADMTCGGPIVIHVAHNFRDAFIEPPPAKPKSIQVHIDD